MLTQVIQLELIDLVTTGLACFNDMLKDVYGDEDGMAEHAIEEINQLTKLLTVPDSTKITMLKQIFREGNIAMVAPDTMNLCDDLVHAGKSFLIEILDQGETLCFLKENQI